MAEKINAIARYRPRVKLGKRALLAEVVKLIVARSTLNEGEVCNALRELRDVIGYLCIVGRPVLLDGIGTFTPELNLDGTLKISHRLSSYLKNEINKPNVFLGDFVNFENIGKTSNELVAIWNEENPDDPIVT